MSIVRSGGSSWQREAARRCVIFNLKMQLEAAMEDELVSIR